MKISRALLLLVALFSATACEVAVERRPVVTTHRRYIRYSDTDPHNRVYYRDDRGPRYYRQHYYEDEPVYRTRVDTRRYSHRAPVDRTYGF